MNFNNWLTQGIIVNIVTMLIVPICTAVWGFWKMRRQSSPLATPTIALTINKRRAKDVTWNIVFFLINAASFVFMPPAENRFQYLALGFNCLGMLAAGALLAWEYGAWRVRRQQAISPSP